ncbi:MAG: nuclear transport factor 2 family protein [Streptosporangiaceae bacterium]
MAADALDPLGRLIAERECERLIIDFVRRLDVGEPDSVAGLFTPDGVWEWPAGGRRVEGRDALRRYFGSRPPDRLSRRLDDQAVSPVRLSAFGTLAFRGRRRSAMLASALSL